MIRFFTTTLIFIVANYAVNADDEIFKAASEPPTQLEVIAEHFSLRNDIYDKGFVTGPLKDLAWNERFNMRNTSLGASLIDTPNFEMGMQGGLRMGRLAMMKRKRAQTIHSAMAWSWGFLPRAVTMSIW